MIQFQIREINLVYMYHARTFSDIWHVRGNDRRNRRLIGVVYKFRLTADE